MQNQGETAFSIIATLSTGPQKTDAVLGPPKERSERPMPKTDAYARPKQDSIQTRNFDTNTPNCSESPMPQIALLGINLLF